MRLSTHIKPISYFKANAAEILEELNETGNAMIITQNGEAKAVIQSAAEYERTQETLALLKILSIGSREIAEGKGIPLEEVMAEFLPNRRKRAA